MKNYIIGFIAVVALVVGVIGVSRNNKVVVGQEGKQGIQGVKGDKGDKGEQGIQGERGLTGPQGPIGPRGPQGSIGMPGQLGAISGPDINSSYLNVNGVTTDYYSSGLNQASTTICAQRAPSATSTLTFASVRFTTATSAVISLEIGKSVGNNTATTTRLGYKVLAANEQATLTALTSTTTATIVGIEPDFVLQPNAWVVVKYGGGGGGSANTLVGKCKFVITEN